jgi:hypothetical protein
LVISEMARALFTLVIILSYISNLEPAVTHPIENLMIEMHLMIDGSLLAILWLPMAKNSDLAIEPKSKSAD